MPDEPGYWPQSKKARKSAHSFLVTGLEYKVISVHKAYDTSQKVNFFSEIRIALQHTGGYDKTKRNADDS